MRKGVIVHLYRTDALAPEYPVTPYERRVLLGLARHDGDRRLCLRCGHLLVPILYGLPVGEAFEARERGEIAIGGCIVFDDQPTVECVGCRRRASAR